MDSRTRSLFAFEFVPGPRGCFAALLTAALVIACSGCTFDRVFAGAGAADAGVADVRIELDAEPADDGGVAIDPDAAIADAGLSDAELPDAIDPPDGGDASAPDADEDAGADGGDAQEPDSTIPPDDAGALPFPYDPSNFDDTAQTPAVAVALSIPGACTYDTDMRMFSGACGASLAPGRVVGPSGTEAVLLAVTSLAIANNGVLTIRGERPLIIAVYGDATLDGAIDASASNLIPGPGYGQVDCDTGRGGTPNAAITEAGGGGGGFGGAGANGGSSGAELGLAGTESGEETLQPLRAGCSGGLGGNGPNGGAGDLGAGGGAVQISVAGTFTVQGRIHASGGGGGAGRTSGGGGGGGSGGGILVEANALFMRMNSGFYANGGSGGQGANGVIPGLSGVDGSRSSDQPAVGLANVAAGGQGGNGAAGMMAPGAGVVPQFGASGGGGGGVGRIRINAEASCSNHPSVVYSPAATFGGQICP